MDAQSIYLIITLVVAGLATGLLAGLFGVGGGAIMVPVLYQAFKTIGAPDAFLMHLSVGTSLAVIIPTSLRSFYGHYKKGAVEMDIVKQWAAPVILGVLLGASVASYAPSSLLRMVFAILTFLNGAKLLFAKQSWRLSQTLPPKWLLKLYGAIIGLLSSLMGIGGGVMGNMVLTLYNIPIHRAVATASALGILISIPGTIGFIAAGWFDRHILPPFSIGYVSLLGFAFLAPLSVLIAPIGVKLAHNLTKRKLEIAFGIFLWLVCLRFIATFMPN